MQNANLLLYVNLSGEVFYIIAHRMKSQKVKEDLQQRVYNDLALAICHPTVVQNLIKGALQILELNMSDVRTLMDRIVHSSIMTVNSYSMEKLFELTLIATRYQYTVCQFPNDILLIAMNHLDTIRKSITDAVGIQLCEKMHCTLVERLSRENSMNMQEYRYAILTYLGDVKLKMTNLIKLGMQKTTGEFVKECTKKISRPELIKPGKIEMDGSNKTLSDNDDDSESGTTESTMVDSEDDNTDNNDNGSLALSDDEDEFLFEDEGCHFEAITVEMNDASKDLDVEEEEDEILEIEFMGNGGEFHESDEAPIGSYVIRFSRYLKEENANTDNLDYDVPFETSYDLDGRRGITLGQSIYDIPGNADEDIENEDRNPTNTIPSLQAECLKPEKEFIDLKAVQGLDLCSILLGCNQSSENSFVCKSQFSGSQGATYLSDISEEDGLIAQLKTSIKQPSPSMTGVNVIRFDARSDRTKSKAALAKISKEFDIEGESEQTALSSETKSEDFFSIITEDD